MEMKYDCSAITASGPCMLALRCYLYTHMRDHFETSGEAIIGLSILHYASDKIPQTTTHSHQICSVRKVNNR